MSKKSKLRTHKQDMIPVPKQDSSSNPIKIVALSIGAILFIIAVATLLRGTVVSGYTSAYTSAISNIGTAAQSTGTQSLGGSLAPINNGIQEVTLSMQEYQYQPYPVRVKVGVPVRFTVDLNTVRGCMRSILIPELGVSERVSAESNVFEFTPSKAGTFRMTCSMGMADGTIIVEDAFGQAPPQKAAAVPVRAGGSCGAGSGGCGCGG